MKWIQAALAPFLNDRSRVFSVVESFLRTDFAPNPMLIESKGIKFSSLFKSSFNSLYTEPLAFKTSDFTNRSINDKINPRNF